MQNINKGHEKRSSLKHKSRSELFIERSSSRILAMNVLWLLCVCCVTSAMAVRPTPYQLDQVSSLFDAFKAKYGKIYTPAEAVHRLQVFISNLARINRLNQESSHAVFGVNKFSDLTAEELKRVYKGLRTEFDNLKSDDGPPECNVLTDDEITATDAPDALDWVAQGAVTSVKNQGYVCGSCWAFTATGQLEGRNFIKHNEFVDLSPQQLVDCDTLSRGCGGGNMENAFRTLIQIGGSMKEEDYPYVAEDGTCKNDKEKAVVKLTSCTIYNLQSQEKVKQQLHEIGPIAIAIRSEGVAYYESGIVSDEICSVGRLDHAVLLVGYGTEDGNDYWLVKNSWGTDWGDEGYMKMQRGDDNTSCGMMNTLMATADIE